MMNAATRSSDRRFERATGRGTDDGAGRAERRPAKRPALRSPALVGRDRAFAFIGRHCGQGRHPRLGHVAARRGDVKQGGRTGGFVD
jgi:hypothetical protein